MFIFCLKLTMFFKHFCMPLHINIITLAHPEIVTQLQQNFGSSPNNWVQYMKSSRVWLDAWLAGLCACAFLIALLRRVLDVSSSITCDLMETWVTGNTEDEITWFLPNRTHQTHPRISYKEDLLNATKWFFYFDQKRADVGYKQLHLVKLLLSVLI